MCGKSPWKATSASCWSDRTNLKHRFLTSLNLWMKATIDLSFLCLKLVKSVSFNSSILEWKNWWNCFSRLAQNIMELVGNVVNHVKDDPERDMENKRTFNALFWAASPHSSKLAESLFLFPPLIFLFWIKTGTKISVGEISKNHQLQAHLRSLPQYVAQHRRLNTLKNRTDGNKWRMAKPLVRPNQLWFPSIPSSSSSNDGLCEHTPLTP